MSEELECPLLDDLGDMGAHMRTALIRLRTNRKVCKVCALSGECPARAALAEAARQAVREVLAELEG